MGDSVPNPHGPEGDRGRARWAPQPGPEPRIRPWQRGRAFCGDCVGHGLTQGRLSRHTQEPWDKHTWGPWDRHTWGPWSNHTWGPRDNDNWQCLGGDGRPWSGQRPGVSAGVRGSWGRGALRPAAILTGGRSLVAGPLGTQAPLKHPSSSGDSKAGGDDGSGPAAAAGGDSEAGTGSGARLSCVPRTRPDPLASNNKHDSNPSQGWRCGGGRPWELRGRKTWGSLSRACGRG